MQLVQRYNKKIVQFIYWLLSKNMV